MRIIWIYKWIRGANNVYSLHMREKEIETYRDVIAFRLKVWHAPIFWTNLMLRLNDYTP